MIMIFDCELTETTGRGVTDIPEAQVVQLDISFKSFFNVKVFCYSALKK